MKPKKQKVRGWIIGNGCWATNQMLIFRTRKGAEDRIYNGGMKKLWKTVPCVIEF